MTRFLALIRSDVGAGLLLLLAAMTAMVLANSPLADTYNGALGTRFRFGIGDWSLEKSALLWINDGLMAIFFLLVGLEIKRELMEGELSDRRRAALPVAGAIGGMIGPALIYAFINRDIVSSLASTFDAADPSSCTAQRPETTVPQQTLFALNSAFIQDRAAKVASQPEITDAPDNAERVRRLYRRSYSREPDATEIEIALQYVTSRGEESRSKTWQQLAHALLASNEFVFVD